MESSEAYDATQRARYTSLTRNKEGHLILLFTRMSEAQKKAGRGEVMMVYSADKGNSWSAPTRIYQGQTGEP